MPRPPARAASAATARRATVEGWLRDLSELRIGDPVVHATARHRPLSGPGASGSGRRRDRVSAPRICRRRQALRAGRATAADQPLQRRRSRSWRRCTSWAAANGTRPRRRRRSRCATPPPNCSPSTPSARRARVTSSASSCTIWKPSPTASVSRKRRTRRRHQRRDRRHDRRQAHGPPGVRRRRLRQDRGGPARGLRARSRTASRWRVLAPTTLLAEQHFQTFTDRFAQVAGDWPVKIAELSRFRSAKEQSQALKELAEGGIDIAIGTHQLLQKDVKFARLGLVDHRRGTPLRRAPEGGAEGPARRGRRADADRHADPAHAGHVAGGPARFLGHRHRAAEAAGDQDLRHPLLRGHHPRSGAARVQARRPGVLPAQRGRHHREHARQARNVCCPRRASSSATAR